MEFQIRKVKITYIFFQKSLYFVKKIIILWRFPTNFNLIKVSMFFHNDQDILTLIVKYQHFLRIHSIHKIQTPWYMELEEDLSGGSIRGLHIGPQPLRLLIRGGMKMFLAHSTTSQLSHAADTDHLKPSKSKGSPRGPGNLFSGQYISRAF